MKRRGSPAGWALAVGGASIAVGLLVASRARASIQPPAGEGILPGPPAGEEQPAELPPDLPSGPSGLPASPEPALPGLLVDPQDVEAGARMLASENPRASRALHVEQLWTQIRSAKPGQSLFDRITAGSGWGPQGGRVAPGRTRPVATSLDASDSQRALVRDVLEGREPSSLPGARKFFEPAQQDRAYAIAQLARGKQARGEPLTDRERRLLPYKRNAAGVRAKWSKERGRLVGTIDGVEFWT